MREGQEYCSNISSESSAEIGGYVGDGDGGGDVGAADAESDGGDGIALGFIITVVMTDRLESNGHNAECLGDADDESES